MVSCCALYLSCLIIYRWLTTSLKVDEDIAVTFPNELYSPTYMRYERAKQEKISTSFDCGPNFSENFYWNLENRHILPLMSFDEESSHNYRWEIQKEGCGLTRALSDRTTSQGCLASSVILFFFFCIFIGPSPTINWPCQLLTIWSCWVKIVIGKNGKA